MRRRIGRRSTAVQLDRRSTAVGLLAAAAVAVVGVVAGCGPALPSTAPIETPNVSAQPSPTSATSATPATLATPATNPTAPGDSGTSLPVGVSVDPGLLEVLPVQVDGVTLEPDPVTAGEVSRDPLLAESALSIAVALAAAPGGPGADDLAVANIIRLRPEVFDVAFYQEWRDTYNEGACEVADGVESETETVIGGHQTFLGRCVGGAATYHTYLDDQGFLISVTATGERRLGEQIIAGLAG